MDRAATIAWIEELAGAAPAMAAIPSDPGARELARVNPTCGDSVRLWAGLDEHGQVRLGGSVRACSLSTAATVLAVRSLTGQNPHGGLDLLDLAVRHRLTGDGPAPDGDLGVLATLELVPLRRRCVAFPWQLAAELLSDVSTG